MGGLRKGVEAGRIDTIVRGLLDYGRPKASATREVDVNPVIVGCKYYSDNRTCSECKANHRLHNNTCEPANAKNCVTYNSIDACNSCKEGALLVKEGDQVNCQVQPISLCAETSNNAPYNCIRCKAGFYLSSEGCQKPNIIIDNCYDYETQNTCKKCRINYALRTDKKGCTRDLIVSTLIDENCNDSVLLAEPTCTVCAAGHRFVGGKCEPACAGFNREGCFFCSSDDPTVCHMCKSGYYHSPTGECIINNEAVENDGQPEEIANPDSNSHTTLPTIIITIIFALLLKS